MRFEFKQIRFELLGPLCQVSFPFSHFLFALPLCLLPLIHLSPFFLHLPGYISSASFLLSVCPFLPGPPCLRFPFLTPFFLLSSGEQCRRVRRRRLPRRHPGSLRPDLQCERGRPLLHSPGSCEAHDQRRDQGPNHQHLLQRGMGGLGHEGLGDLLCKQGSGRADDQARNPIS
jgi:hypothetical protein